MNIALADLPRSAGQNLGTTPWLTIDSDRVAQFIAATGSDDYFAVSLTNYFLPHLLEVTGITSGVNYGADSARFGTAPRAGDRIRASAEVLAADPVAGGVHTVIRITVDVDGADTPACVVDSVSRWMA